MARIAAVDERFQFYNLEMVGVTGGQSWKPYELQPSLAQPDPDDYASEAFCVSFVVVKVSS